LAGRAYQDVESSILAPPAVAMTEKERSGTGMIAGFVTDMRTPVGFAAKEAPVAASADFAREEEEEERQREIQKEVDYLLWETGLWRLANSALWIMWGVMQAKIPGLPVELGGQEYSESPQLKELQLPDSGFVDGDTDLVKAQDVGQRLEASEQGVGNGMADAGGVGAEGLVQDVKDMVPEGGIGAEENDFDYLGYSRERAMFFWGDAVKLGIVKMEELPEDLRKEIKIVEY
jgi:choline kinase